MHRRFTLPPCLVVSSVQRVIRGGTEFPALSLKVSTPQPTRREKQLNGNCTFSDYSSSNSNKVRWITASCEPRKQRMKLSNQ